MTRITMQEAFALALQHHQSGRLAEAEQLYRQILAQDPKRADAIHNLGVLAYQTGRINEAIAAYRRAIELFPDYAEAYNNLGNVLRDRGQPDEAIAAFRRAIAIKPSEARIYFNLGNTLSDTGEIELAIAAYRQAMVLDPGSPAYHSNLISSLHYDPAYSARAIAEEERLWNLQHAQQLLPIEDGQPGQSTPRQSTPGQSGPRHSNDPRRDRRLRVGYVSADFWAHASARFLVPLFEHHDPREVELFCYAQVIRPDAVTHRMQKCVSRWRSTLGLSDEQVAQQIRADRIDILVDLKCHTSDNRLLVFARKPAPIQLTWLAYPGSTGLTAIDYRLSDPYLDQPAGDESCYSEKTIRLPETYWCYQPGIEPSAIRQLPALQQGHITFGCLNNLCKLNVPTLVHWAKLLIAVPNSRILIHAYECTRRQRLQDQLKQEGVEPSRVRFVGFVSAEEYYDLYQQIDIALDTSPYCGGTTTCDALWMGVPVVSRVGETAVGRSGLSLLSNVGLPELVAHSDEEYVRLAGELARDIPRLGNLRSTLRQKMEQSPLMDAPTFARNIEAAYRQMWEGWCDCGGSGITT